MAIMKHGIVFGNSWNRPPAECVENGIGGVKKIYGVE
jgi:hypothetical protein